MDDLEDDDYSQYSSFEEQKENDLEYIEALLEDKEGDDCFTIPQPPLPRTCRMADFCDGYDHHYDNNIEDVQDDYSQEAYYEQQQENALEYLEALLEEEEGDNCHTRALPRMANWDDSVEESNDDESDDDDATPIEYALLRTLADRNVKEKEQVIYLHDFHLNGVNMQYIVDFFERNLSEMERLDLLLCEEVADEAVEVLRTFLEDSTLRELFLSGSLGNEQGGRLLSGLHGNPSIKKLTLGTLGLEDAGRGGDILSSLLQNMPVLNNLVFGNPLGVEGARALQPGIRTNQTVRVLVLHNCEFDDEGLSSIVDALEGNNTIINIGLGSNGITSNGLPLVTRLLQHPSIEVVSVDSNPGLFDNEENTRLFSSALRSAKKVVSVCFNRCRLPGHAVIALFQAAAMNKTLQRLHVFDHEQLEGEELMSLLEIIPQVRNLTHLSINLDFVDATVVSAFHLNTSVLHLNDDFEYYPIDTGPPVSNILKRNHLLLKVTELLDGESRQMVPAGLWAKAIEHITCDNTGASAAFKIMCEKLVMWWAPPQQAASTTPVAIPPPAGVAAASCTVTIKRLRAQVPMGGDANDTDEAKSSSSLLLEPQPKRHRRHFSPLPESTDDDKGSSTTVATASMINNISIDSSFSKEVLIEMIQQLSKKNAEQADTIAKLVNNTSTEEAETDEEA